MGNIDTNATLIAAVADLQASQADLAGYRTSLAAQTARAATRSRRYRVVRASGTRTSLGSRCRAQKARACARCAQSRAC